MDRIIKIVNKLVRIHETRNPFKIAQGMGFEMKYDDYDEVKGFYIKALKKKYIYINQNLDELSRHIVCAHELGHGVLHNIEDTYFLKEHTLFPVHSRTEREANTFAAELILNDDLEIAAFYSDGRTLDDEVFQKLWELKNKKRGGFYG